MPDKTPSPDVFVSQSAARAAGRDSLFLQAHIVLPETGEQMVVRVRNLSAGGFLAESAYLVPVGAPLRVELPNVGFVQGRCVWSNDGKFGVAFSTPIAPSAVRRKTQAAAAPAVFKPFDPVAARMRVVTQKRPI